MAYAKGRKVRPVTVEDGLDSPLFAKMRQQKLSTTLTADVALDDKIINVASVTGAAVGDVVLLRDTVYNRFAFFEVVAINTLAVTLDGPVDHDFLAANTSVSFSTSNLAVNGSVTPQVFSVRPETAEQVNVTAHVTRIIFTCVCTGAVTLEKFADLTALTNGLLLRHVDGETINYFNVKSNIDLASLAYDFEVYQASNPAQGLNGFTCRLTFAGNSKMGTALRVRPTDDLQLIVQDNLSTITELGVMVEGHVF